MNDTYFDEYGKRAWGHTTAGRITTFAEMDHSHISNAYWHLRMRPQRLNQFTNDAAIALQLRDYIEHKFGYVMEYRPWTESEVRAIRGFEGITIEDVLIKLDGMTIGYTDWRERVSTETTTTNA